MTILLVSLSTMSQPTPGCDERSRRGVRGKDDVSLFEGGKSFRHRLPSLRKLGEAKRHGDQEHPQGAFFLPSRRSSPSCRRQLSISPSRLRSGPMLLLLLLLSSLFSLQKAFSDDGGNELEISEPKTAEKLGALVDMIESETGEMRISEEMAKQREKDPSIKLELCIPNPLKTHARVNTALKNIDLEKIADGTWRTFKYYFPQTWNSKEEEKKEKLEMKINKLPQREFYRVAFRFTGLNNNTTHSTHSFDYKPGVLPNPSTYSGMQNYLIEYERDLGQGIKRREFYFNESDSFANDEVVGYEIENEKTGEWLVKLAAPGILHEEHGFRRDGKLIKAEYRQNCQSSDHNGGINSSKHEREWEFIESMYPGARDLLSKKIPKPTPRIKYEKKTAGDVSIAHSSLTSYHALLGEKKEILFKDQPYHTLHETALDFSCLDGTKATRDLAKLVMSHTIPTVANIKLSLQWGKSVRTFLQGEKVRDGDVFAESTSDGNYLKSLDVFGLYWLCSCSRCDADDYFLDNESEKKIPEEGRDQSLVATINVLNDDNDKKPTSNMRSTLKAASIVFILIASCFLIFEKICQPEKKRAVTKIQCK